MSSAFAQVEGCWEVGEVGPRLTVSDAGWMLSVEGVVQLLQRMAAESDDDGYFSLGQNKRPPFCQHGLHFGNRYLFPPFHDRPEVDA